MGVGLMELQPMCNLGLAHVATTKYDQPNRPSYKSKNPSSDGHPRSAYSRLATSCFARRYENLLRVVSDR